MTDPHDSLVSFQQALLDEEIKLLRCEFDRNLFYHLDLPNGEPRMTFARLEGNTVVAMAIIAKADPFEGCPCFQIGYAVPIQLRNQGRAKDIVRAAISEFQKGIRRNGLKELYIEAIISAGNIASQRVAEQVISTEYKNTTDTLSGTPALQYISKRLA